jgi:hypothetical protein
MEYIKYIYKISVVQEINISKLELQNGPMNLLFTFLKYIFGIEVVLIPFVIMQSKSQLDI